MSDTEAIMWAVEKDPALRSDFCNLTILEHVARRRPPPRTTLARALAAIPRLGQRVVGAPLRIVPPAFADDPTLDLDAHVRRVALPGAGRRPRAARPLRRARRAAARPGPPAVGVHAHRRARRRPRRAAAEGPPHDHRRRRRPEALARVRRLRARPAPPHDAPRRRTRPPSRRGAQRHAAAGVRARAVADATRAQRRRVCPAIVGDGRHVRHAPDASSRRARPTPRALARLAAAPGARHRTRPLRRDARPLAAPPLRDARAPAARGAGAPRTSSAAASTTRSSPALAGALGRYHERFGSDGRRAAPRDADQHPRPRRRRRQPLRAGARRSCRSNPPHDPPTLFGDVRDRLHAAKQRDRARRGRGPRRCSSPVLPTSLLVAMTRAQTRTIDFAAIEPPRQPGPALPRRRAHRRELSVRPAHRHRARTSRCSSYCDELHLGLNIDPAAITDVDAFMRDVDDVVRRRSLAFG